MDRTRTQYAQIGLIMLIGLAAKNAILIVEFAKAEHERGTPLTEAALLTARLRFRPILMTAFAFILGVVPLLTAARSPRWPRQERRRRTPQSIARAPDARNRTQAPPPPPPLIPPGLPAALLERRPDVVEAEQLLVAANSNVGAAEALLFPAISLTGFLGRVSGTLFTLLGGSGAAWQTAPAILQPVFNGGRLRRNLEATRASYDEAVAQ
jgi:hypothetical protein